jgi:hypothetical protein
VLKSCSGSNGERSTLCLVASPFGTTRSVDRLSCSVWPGRLTATVTILTERRGLSDFDIPADISKWLSDVFVECNERVTEKLCNNPNIQEEWLDYSWIEQLSRFSTPATLGSGWIARMQAHYLGGMRHWRMWEIADIGVLLFIRSPTAVLRRKVALLQSKRLYPTNMAVSEDAMTDYAIGFARLADPEDLGRSIALAADYDLTEESRYGALIAKSDQSKAIIAYEKKHRTPVYYQFYNPWRLPFSQHVPIDGYATPDGPLELGVRLVPSQTVHNVLASRKKSYRPMIEELKAGSAPDGYGWRLEDFMAAEFLGCREGALFESTSQPR